MPPCRFASASSGFDLARVVNHAVAKDLDVARLLVDLDDAGGDAVRPGRVRAEAALLLGLVVDVPDLEVTLRLERRLGPLHVRSGRVALHLVADLVQRNAPAVRAPHGGP